MERAEKIYIRDSIEPSSVIIFNLQTLSDENRCLYYIFLLSPFESFRFVIYYARRKMYWILCPEGEQKAKAVA